MPSPTQHIGMQVQHAAKALLESHGLLFVNQNFHTRYGEIDLIMQDQQTIVFVEVRYRKTSGFGDGFASITAKKQRNITQAAYAFLQQKPELQNKQSRFDVISASSINQLNWLKNAFEAAELL